MKPWRSELHLHSDMRYILCNDLVLPVVVIGTFHPIVARKESVEVHVILTEVS